MHRDRSVRNRSLILAFAACSLLGTVATAVAYPKPHHFPVRWELDFEPGDLRLYIDPSPEPGEAAAYWYFTYKVVNNTGSEKMWAPRLTLFTDRGDIINSGTDVPPQVEQEILSLLGNDLLERQNQVIGNLFTGERNAVEGLAVWPAGNLDSTEMSLFITGISGETASVTNPITGKNQVLAKTLRRDYVVPGDPAARGSAPVQLVEESWVMR